MSKTGMFTPSKDPWDRLTQARAAIDGSVSARDILDALAKVADRPPVRAPLSSPMLGALPQSARGVPVFLNDQLVKYREDWSGCRSISRARRRQRQGHPQRMRSVPYPDPDVYKINGAMVMHPETYRALRQKVERMERGDDPLPLDRGLLTEGEAARVHLRSFVLGENPFYNLNVVA